MLILYLGSWMEFIKVCVYMCVCLCTYTLMHTCTCTHKCTHTCTTWIFLHIKKCYLIVEIILFSSFILDIFSFFLHKFYWQNAHYSSRHHNWESFIVHLRGKPFILFFFAIECNVQSGYFKFYFSNIEAVYTILKWILL